MHWIARWIIRWTIALRLILVNSTGRVDAAASVLAQIAVAEACLMRIALASWIARALETVQSLPTLGVNAARSSQTFISA